MKPLRRAGPFTVVLSRPCTYCCDAIPATELPRDKI